MLNFRAGVDLTPLKAAMFDKLRHRHLVSREEFGINPNTARAHVWQMNQMAEDADAKWRIRGIKGRGGGFRLVWRS
jgi:hypothetical protein